MIIKDSLKLFFKNIIYIFIPMGVIYLFILLFLYAFINSSANDVIALIEEISNITGENVSLDGNDVFGYVIESLQQLNFHSSVTDIVIQIFNGSFFNNIIKDILEMVFKDSTLSSEIINDLVSSTTSNIVINLTISIILILLSIPLSYLLTSTAIRRHNARKNWKQRLIFYLVKPLTYLAYSLIIVLFVILWQPSIFISITVVVFVNSYLSLLQAYLTYRDNNIHYKDIVTVKNATFFLLSDIIILLICMIVIIPIYIVYNVLLAVILAVPILIYAMNILSVNTHAYVYSIFTRVRYQLHHHVTNKN